MEQEKLILKAIEKGMPHIITDPNNPTHYDELTDKYKDFKIVGIRGGRRTGVPGQGLSSKKFKTHINFHSLNFMSLYNVLDIYALLPRWTA